MNEWEKNRRMAESYRQSYPPGTRLELIGMDDPFAPIPAGMRGTVNYVDDQSQISGEMGQWQRACPYPGHRQFSQAVRKRD